MVCRRRPDLSQVLAVIDSGGRRMHVYPYIECMLEIVSFFGYTPRADRMKL
jgi:hypothetical protein